MILLAKTEAGSRLLFYFTEHMKETMNNKKIAFIICTNDEQYLEECIGYIEQLSIPLPFEKDIISIRDATSMAEAYNAAMQSSDAKYKVYLHQDVFIYNTNFIAELINVFQSDESLGLLGVLGGVDLPRDAVAWNAWNRGRTYACNNKRGLLVTSGYQITLDYAEVEAVDGMLMATQYDIPWREDLELGWDFYDVSQSLEFRRKGYKVGVPQQKIPWCMHDCGHSKLSQYDEARKRLLMEYNEFFDASFEQQYAPEVDQMEKQIFSLLKNALESRNMELAFNIYNMVNEHSIRNNDLQYALNITEIGKKELENNVFNRGFFHDVMAWEEMKRKYISMKFVIWQIEQGKDGEEYKRNIELLDLEESIKIVIYHSALNAEKMNEYFEKQ